MRCHLATAMTIEDPASLMRRHQNKALRSITRFVTRPLADGLRLTDHLVAGAAASAAAVSALHPMDTLKTVIQKAASASASSSASSAAAAAATAPQSLNTLSAFMLTLRTGGVPALYRGLMPSLGGQVPAGAVKFAAYETLTQIARSVAPRFGLTAACEYTCAALAFVACSVIMVPSELIKQRMQAGVYGSSSAALASILGLNNTGGGGIRSMYTGYGATLMRDVPYTMLEFGLYAQFKRVLRNTLRTDKLSPGQELALGGLAGGCTGFLTTPFDVAKTKLMTQATGPTKQYKGIVDVLVKVARSEGIPGLFKGSAARVVWLIPFTAVYFGVHEMTKRALLNRNQLPAVAKPSSSSSNKEIKDKQI